MPINYVYIHYTVHSMSIIWKYKPNIRNKYIKICLVKRNTLDLPLKIRLYTKNNNNISKIETIKYLQNNNEHEGLTTITTNK